MIVCEWIGKWVGTGLFRWSLNFWFNHAKLFVYKRQNVELTDWCLENFLTRKVRSIVMASILSGLWTYVIEYETPRLVRIHNRKLGLCRRIIQLSIVAYVCLYALWLQRGYQVSQRIAFLLILHWNMYSTSINTQNN